MTIITIAILVPQSLGQATFCKLDTSRSICAAAFLFPFYANAGTQSDSRSTYVLKRFVNLLKIAC
jgi:hypothetical protein